MVKQVRLEICIDSVRSALAAQAGGASRVELCDNLLVGGTTPSFGMIKGVRQAVSLELHVLIRPRGGDFCYTEAELAVMLADIQAAKDLGADGVVLGVLDPQGAIAMEPARRLIAAARPLRVTWHRAFDMARNPQAALQDILALGCDYLLTSGQAQTAFAGRELIADLVGQAAGKIIIMPGGGVQESNIRELRQITGATEFHSSGREIIEGQMQWRRPDLFMGAWQQSEYDLAVVSQQRVAAMLAETRKVGND